MIISHHRKFIFMKTQKTAGTSVEIALTSICGDEDVISAFGSSADQATRLEMSGRSNQNDRYPLASYRVRDWGRLVLRGKPKTMYSHSTARAIKDIAGSKAWDTYFKFAIERNPWDAAVSHYYWKHSEQMSFQEYLRSPKLDFLDRNWDIYSLNGVPSADAMVRFESLEEDLAKVAHQIGVTEPLALPRAKGATPRPRGSYRDLYESEDVKLVAEKAKRQIDLLGYEF